MNERDLTRLNYLLDALTANPLKFRKFLDILRAREVSQELEEVLCFIHDEIERDVNVNIRSVVLSYLVLA